MKAIIKPNVDNNRQILADLIPLDAPFSVYIEQTRVCNFKCFYCIHSTRDDAGSAFQKLGYEVKHMKQEEMEKIVAALKEFPQGKIKRIVFSGLGEPTANPKLPKFIKMVVDADIAPRVEMITNGLLLNEKMIDELTDSGLTKIIISIQGLDNKDYFDTCAAKIDFDKFLNTLKYFYEHKKNTEIYIKIVDAALKNKDDDKRFYEMFSPLSDQIYIEHLIQMQQSHTQIKEIVDGKSFYGEEVDKTRKVCAPVFYFLQIGCDLDIYPCPVPGLSRKLSMGNLKNNSLLEIWNGSKRFNLLKIMLKMQKDTLPDCNGCECFNCITDTAEYLDDDADRLLKIFEEKERKLCHQK